MYDVRVRGLGLDFLVSEVCAAHTRLCMYVYTYVYAVRVYVCV